MTSESAPNLLPTAERIAVVGLGAVTCLGPNLDSTWQGLVAGRSGLKRHPQLDLARFLQDIAGLSESVPVESSAAKLDARFIHLAMEAARQALEPLAPAREYGALSPDRVAVVIGSALGGMDLYESEQARALQRKSLAVSPYLVPGLIINQAAGQVAQQFGLYGPSIAPANACASGGHSVALGAMLLRSGEADVALCGASESCITPMVVNGFATMKALMGRRGEDRSIADPSQASRPFSADRTGFVLSEGAGMLLLARESVAQRFGLMPQAEVLGWAVNTDGYHMAMPNADRIVRCLETALRHAGLRPEQVDHYNAHGTSTLVNDKVETDVLKRVFGERARSLPVTSIKGALGHSLGAASAIEAAVSVRTLVEQVLPPTVNYKPDPELDLDYVPNEARAAVADIVMSASFGFGGTNNALIFRRWRDG